MAKISRRAVASSSSSFSPSTSSTSSSSGPTAYSSFASSAPASTGSSTSSSPNANTISVSGKSTRVAASENSAKYLESNNNNLNSATAYPDPLHDSHATNAGYASTSTGSVEYTPYTARPAHIDRVDAATPSFTPPHLQNETIQAQILAAERERIRAEFFATYDVMTGVRIAATLGGFFGLMVFLIVWKSRSSSNETLKVLKDPKMAAVAAVCMQEEEEREIQEAIVATGMSIYPDEDDAIAYRRQRMLSLGNVSAPPMLNRGFRFSSVGGGGYSSLLEPPRRFSYSAVSGAGSMGGGGRRKSGSESSRVLSNYPLGSSFGTDDYFMETEDEMEEGDYPQSGKRFEELRTSHKRTDSTKSKHGFLEVPLMGQDSRRSSAMTCCSTESSYLERRCSAFTLGLSNLPNTLQRKLSTASRTSSTDNWDYYYPDIQVIQPTPKPSPCPSERSIYEQIQAQNKSAVTASKTPVATVATVATTTSLAAAAGAATVTTISAGNYKPTKAPQAVANYAAPPSFVRKQSIAYYDPDSAQAGRKQQIHSISADTADLYSLTSQTAALIGGGGGGLVDFTKPIQSAPPVGVHHGFHFTDSPTEELRLSMRRKLATTAAVAAASGGAAYENNNNFPYNNSAAAIAAAAAVAAAATAAAANSSSISIDSTPLSIDKLNGSGSLGTVSAKALFNVERRAPLASLSSFKISSLEYPDSEQRSVDEDDSVFVESAADTDEDMQQLSSDSEEISLGPHEHGVFSRENTVLVAPIAGAPEVSQRRPNEKRHGLGAQTNTTANTYTNSGADTATPHTVTTLTARAQSRRMLLQRNRTASVSSSERVSLLSAQQLKEFPAGSEYHLTVGSAVQAVPLETHFGAIICTDSPPTHPRRAQLLQQYSDPQSLPTTTTTTTTTTEEDTCSTLNTELCGGDGGSGEYSGVVSIGTFAGGSGGGGGGEGGSTTTHTQYSSLNTVVSLGRSSPGSYVPDGSFTPSKQMELPQNANTTTTSTTTARQADDRCASSISDTAAVIGTPRPRQPVICMPSSLKNLILRGSNSSDKIIALATNAANASIPNIVTRSATNLLLDPDGMLENTSDLVGGPSVTLELPLIKLPTEDSSDSSTASEHNGRACSKSDSSRDPSLPGSSRKWSKETLF